jgi:type IV fimbrial biogenesis protein FimT
LLGHEKYEDRIPDYPYLSARIVKDPSVPFKCSWPTVLWPSFGFTLVELLIVIAIAAILTTIALPSFQDISERNRVVADVNKLVRALNLARSEAIKRRVRAVLCSSSNPEANLPSCSNTGTWTQGWILFADTVNNNTQFDNGEPLIAVHNGLQSGNTLKWNNGNNIRYLPSGTTSNLGGTFTICSQDNKHARGIIISSSGRVRLSNDSDTLTCP